MALSIRPDVSTRRTRWLPWFLSAATVLFASVTAVAGVVPPFHDPMQPASTGGLPLVDRALARLSTHERLLVVAAHPDDEDTTLLTYVSRARGGEAAYLSLTRGDGGQNLLGEELGTGLGLLRSRELQAARQVDGARQFFTRAYDFGYTRSLDETLERWPIETLVSDALRVVRRFKPQVIVAVFPPDARAGHGQHQASAVVARRVFDLVRAAAEDAAEDDGALWKPSSLFRAAFFLRQEGDAPGLTLPLGTVDAVSGRTIFQIAMESRSRHRCQDMGLLQPLGDADGKLAWVAGSGEDSKHLFDGIDTSLSAMADPLLDPDLRRRVAVQLDAVETAAESARVDLSARRMTDDPRPLVEALSGIVRRLGSVLALLTEEGGGAAGTQVVHELVEEKLEISHEALAAALGLAVDAFVETDLSAAAVLVPGQTFDVRVQAWQQTAGRGATAHDAAAPQLGVSLQDVRLVAADGSSWEPRQTLEPKPQRGFFATQIESDRVLRLRVPADAPPTVPYFLQEPLQSDLYDWPEELDEVRGEPFGPPVLTARFHVSLGDLVFRLEREVVYRIRDQARGEVRRPLRIVPGVEVSLSDDLRVWPSGEGAARTSGLSVLVHSHLSEPVEGMLELQFQALESGPVDLPMIEPMDLRLDPGEHRTVPLDLATVSPLPGRYRLTASFRSGATIWNQAMQVIDYEHVRPVTKPVPASLDLVVADIALPGARRVAYVRGASDRVPEMLQELGLPVDVLTAAQLAKAKPSDLAEYDALVIGSRAYETDPALAQANSKVLGYAERGGLVVVQYQQYQFARGGFAPYPLDIDRPHDRVTDETAPVRILVPEHPVFTTPNRITEADWNDWVQERGLYFAGTWDEAYMPLLAMADPERDEVRGALLVADVGKGRYVYTGLAFFRQLPAGVPGAYRLLMNLLALRERQDAASAN